MVWPDGRYCRSSGASRNGRFETAEEIEDNMPLSLSVQPDTVIRVRMEFKAVDGDFRVTEQSLETPQRTGFTVVEWGGTELD